MSLFMFDDANHAAVIEKSGIQHTYAEVKHDFHEIIKQINDHKKKLVFIYAGNNYATLIGYLACIHSNTACMMINVKTPQNMLDELVLLYKPDFVWMPETEGSDQYLLKPYGFERRYVIHPDVKLLVPTSGSTGSPKLVKLSLQNLESNAAAIIEYLEITSEDRPILSLPVYYIYGTSIVNSHLAAGATLLLTDDDVMTAGFWQYFKKYKATSIAGVPYTYEILKRLNIFNMELPSLKYMTQAGGKLSSELVSYFGAHCHEKGIRFYVMYGQTEASPRMTYLPDTSCIRKPGSIGIPVPGGNLMIWDDDRTALPAGEIGQIVYFGPNVMMGYSIQEADLEKGDELKGCLLTGDVGYMDDDGYFYITGRMARFIKINGIRFSLDEIESALKKDGYDIAVGGKDNSLLVAATDPDSLEAIKELVAEKYHLHHSVINTLYKQELIRSDSGKLQYKEIFEL